MHKEALKQFPEEEKLKPEFELDYEPFDPEVELEKVRKSSKEARAEKLKNYRKELMHQKEGIAEIQGDLEEKIRKNPDSDQKELMNIVLAEAPTYRLSEKQLGLFKRTLHRYIYRHQKINITERQYPDKNELFNACFGKYPEGDIEIIKSPITVFIRCHNIKDYAWIDAGKYLKSPKKTKLKKSEIQSVVGVHAHVVHKCLVPSLNNLIAAENARSITRAQNMPSLKHEEQHIINKLFEKQKLETPKIKNFKENPSLNKLTSYLRFLRKDWIDEPHAKNEMLAFYKQGNYTLKNIKKELLKSKKEGGHYDFYDIYKDDIEKEIKDRLESKVVKKNKTFINKKLQQVFIDEYEQSVTKALRAINNLEKIGKSKKEVLNLIVTEPLTGWHKLVKRIKEIKE